MNHELTADRLIERRGELCDSALVVALALLGIVRGDLEREPFSKTVSLSLDRVLQLQEGLQDELGRRVQSQQGGAA